MKKRSLPRDTQSPASVPSQQWTRRNFLQVTTLAASAAGLAACGTEVSPEGSADAVGDAAGDAALSDVSADVAVAPLDAVGAGAKVAHGPTAGGVTDGSVRLAVRLDGPAKVQFRLTAGGQTYLSHPALTQSAEDFAVVLDVTGLPAGTTFAVETLVDEVADTTGALATHTFPTAGTAAAFDFCFGSCCRYDEEGSSETGGKTFEVAAGWVDKPLFFAQIGDWTYPDYAFVKSGVDEKGNNHTVYPEELRKAWRRRFTAKYPLRKLLQKTPIAHVWDDHDFAENNAWKGVTGDQALRLAHFSRYVPSYPLTPLVTERPKDAGPWQKFTVGHCEFFLVDMRSQRTRIDEAIVSYEENGATHLKLVEPPGHTMLGADQLKWLLESLQASTAKWKFVFFPIEVNPRYDQLMTKALDMDQQLIVSALGDSWVGYPTERNKILELHTSGKVPNMIFMTGDAHMAAMKGREPESPPVFMAANLDISQAPIMDAVEAIAEMPKSAIWPEWSQGGDGESTIGRVRVITSPKHQVVFESWGASGALLHSMTIDAV